MWNLMTSEQKLAQQDAIVREVNGVFHVNGERKSTGLIPRPYSTHPQGCYAFAPAFPDELLIPQDQLKPTWDALVAAKATLLDLRNAYYETLKSLDQDGLGLCWNFSTTKSVMYGRAIAGLPGVRLSGWYGAGIINGWRDQGGWGASSMKFAIEHGVPDEAHCPSYKSSYDTADTRANAETNKVTEWWDGPDDPLKAKWIAMSMLCRATPCVVDLNDMSHSMCCIGMTWTSSGRWQDAGLDYDNSWGESGGPDRGLYHGTGARARPDGLVIPRVTRAFPA